MSNLTVTEKITKSKIKAQLQKPFFAYLLLNCPIIDMTGKLPMPTMATDIKGRIYYDSKYVESLTENQLQGVLFHEIMHQALLHLVRKGSRDENIWNVACDLVVNGMLNKNNVELPDGTLLPDYNGDYKIGDQTIKDVTKKSAEEIYDEIQSNEKLQKQLKKLFKPMDTHIFVDPQTGEGQSKDGSIKIDKNGKVQGKNLSPDQKKEIERKWKQHMTEAVQFAKMKGNLPGGMERVLDELLEPEINWRTLLNKYVVATIPYDSSWRTPHKKSISAGCYMPNIIREQVEVTVAIDVSGSISKKEYTEFIGEMIGIAKCFQQVKMNVLFWDTKVGTDIEIQGADVDAINRQNVSGYGGTDFSCVARYLKKENKTPKVVVCFTDGYIEGNPTEPEGVQTMIYVICSNGTDEIVKKSDRGIVIKMKKDFNNDR